MDFLQGVASTVDERKTSCHWLGLSWHKARITYHPVGIELTRNSLQA